MAKVTVNICLDPDVWMAAREHYGNLSGAVNDFLKEGLIERNPKAKETLDWNRKCQLMQEKYDKLKKKVEKKADKYQEYIEKTTRPLFDGRGNTYD